MSTVTLKDGSQVAEAVYTSTTMSLIAVQKENPIAFSDLFRKCKYADTTFMINRNYEDSKTTLTRYALIGEDQEVHADVRKVVLNSIQLVGLSLRLVNPLKSEQVQKIQ